MSPFLLALLFAVALALPALVGWRGWGWRGMAALVALAWGLLTLCGIVLSRADQECLATPGCESWSGVVWTLLLAAAVGYPLVSGPLVALGGWARRKDAAQRA